MSKKILHIIPAVGWAALSAMQQENGIWQADAIPLACWALVEDEDGERGVEGLGGADYIDFEEDWCNFLSYLAPGEDVREWDIEAKRYGERQAAKALKSVRAAG